MSVPDFEWYDPPRGAGVPPDWTVEHLVSYHRDTTEAVKKAANKLADDASFVLAAHRKTGDAQIKVVHETHVPDGDMTLGDRRGGSLPMKLDSIVYLQASDTGDEMDGNPERAATSIEFGWKPKARKLKDGTKKKYKPIEGIAPLTTALKKSIAERRLEI